MPHLVPNGVLKLSTHNYPRNEICKKDRAESTTEKQIAALRENAYFILKNCPPMSAHTHTRGNVFQV